jgi:hypothetical protein
MSGNPFLRDPNADPTVQTAANIDVMNTLSAVLLEHGKFNEKTFERLKKLFDETGLRWWIILAGVGGACEVVRILWDSAAFLWSHYH